MCCVSYHGLCIIDEFFISILFNDFLSKPQDRHNKSGNESDIRSFTRSELGEVRDGQSVKSQCLLLPM